MTIFDSIKYPITDNEAGLPSHTEVQLLPKEIQAEYSRQWFQCGGWMNDGGEDDLDGVRLLRKIILEWNT